MDSPKVLIYENQAYILGKKQKFVVLAKLGKKISAIHTINFDT